MNLKQLLKVNLELDLTFITKGSILYVSPLFDWVLSVNSGFLPVQGHVFGNKEIGDP